MKLTALILAVCGGCLFVAFCASPPARSQEHCISPAAIKAQAGDMVIADFGETQTQLVLAATGAPPGFEAEEIIAVPALRGQVVILFFHADCVVHIAQIPLPTFEEIRKLAESSAA